MADTRKLSEIWDNEIRGPMDEKDWTEQDRLTYDWVYRRGYDPKTYFRDPEQTKRCEAYVARMKAAQAASPDAVIPPGMPPDSK